MISNEINKNMQNSSWIRKMFEEGERLAKIHGKENIYDYSIGNPFAEPPIEVINSLIKHSSEKGVHRYMSNAGFLDVRKTMANEINKNIIDKKLSYEHVVMTCGAAGALNTVLRAILNPGEEVIVFTPYFVEYGFYIQNHNGIMVTINNEKTNFQPNLDELKKKITKKTKAIIINSPNNPTGVVYKENILKEMSLVIKEKEEEFNSKIFIISDEPYSKIVYNNIKIPNILNIFENGIIVNSFSKSLGLAGERIGYIAVNPKIENVSILMNALIFCNRTLGFGNAPALAQKAVADGINSSVNIADYQEKRDFLYDNLTRLGFTMVNPEGTFYLFPKSPIKNDIEFVKFATKYNILLVPGSGFGCPGYFRMSYCVDFNMIKRSISAFEKMAKDLNLIK
ncbi:aspartate aminotransferase [Hypnocyclicus thermotrophus]|uniref:Aminotransferase n=1 Tax=Hypnocyclicus thermotrophus TaxID=1627895 RepID=A0AA46DZK1_9FUSO|nr:pyridoxal phosphate-dependent aminotransferase [Hypnocyclicus thermotrophus]TDT71780.1 aspartate aminotransferase [Hypnocyclicus thermotrophus]